MSAETMTAAPIVHARLTAAAPLAAAARETVNTNFTRGQNCGLPITSAHLQELGWLPEQTEQWQQAL